MRSSAAILTRLNRRREAFEDCCAVAACLRHSRCSRCDRICGPAKPVASWYQEQLPAGKGGHDASKSERFYSYISDPCAAPLPVFHIPLPQSWNQSPTLSLRRRAISFLRIDCCGGTGSWQTRNRPSENVRGCRWIAQQRESVLRLKGEYRPYRHLWRDYPVFRRDGESESESARCPSEFNGSSHR